MKEILEVILKNVIEQPESLSITEKSNDNNSICYEVKVAKEDMGRVIGKQGQTANSIRTIIKAIASKEHKKVIVEFKTNE